MFGKINLKLINSLPSSVTNRGLIAAEYNFTFLASRLLFLSRISCLLKKAEGRDLFVKWFSFLIDAK